MSKYYDPTSKTAAEWLELAEQSARTSRESFERSDTDGFLSQWANDSMSRMYRSLAELAKDGGMAEFVVLATAEGVEIEGARQVETSYGFSWVHEDEQGTHWFNESNAQNPAVAARRNAEKGYSFITVKKPAVARFAGTMTLGVVWEPKTR